MDQNDAAIVDRLTSGPVDKGGRREARLTRGSEAQKVAGRGLGEKSLGSRLFCARAEGGRGATASRALGRGVRLARPRMTEPVIPTKAAMS